MKKKKEIESEKMRIQSLIISAYVDVEKSKNEAYIKDQKLFIIQMKSRLGAIEWILL